MANSAENIPIKELVLYLFNGISYCPLSKGLSNKIKSLGLKKVWSEIYLKLVFGEKSDLINKLSHAYFPLTVMPAFSKALMCAEKTGGFNLVN